MDIAKDSTPSTSGYDIFILFKDEFCKLKSLDDESKWKEFFSLLVSYFIIDVTENTMKNILTILKNKEIDEVRSIDDFNRKYILKQLVDFSEVGKKFNKIIEDFVEKKIINSFNVNRFDGKGKYILRQLFKAYYENPRQMPKNQLKILSVNLIEIIEKYPILNTKFSILDMDFKELFEIDYEGVYFDYNNIDSLLEILKFNSDYKISEEDYEDFSKSMYEIMDILDINIQEYFKLNFDSDETVRFLFFNLFNKVNYYSLDELNNFPKDSLNFILFIKGWVELHYVYLSVICDFIAQMTDDYALKEYNDLYSI